MAVSVRVRDRLTLARYLRAYGPQRKLARQTGINATSINLLVQGRRTRATVDTAVRIEDELGVPRGTLFVLADRDLVLPYVVEQVDVA